MRRLTHVYGATAVLSSAPLTTHYSPLVATHSARFSSSAPTHSPPRYPTYFTGGLLQPSAVLLRPQTIKPNPNEATSGQFEKSFEKITESIETRHPFRQHHVKKGNIYDVNFGEKTEADMYREAEEDLTGTEPERTAARQARSYFSDEDLSPAALHVRSPRLKVAQLPDRQHYDKKLLKTTCESAEYYYPIETKEERYWWYAKLAVGWSVVGVATFVGGRRALHYMRTAG